MKNYTQSCSYGDFLAAEFNVAAYGSNQGAIGLGMGTPKFGKSGMQAIKGNSNGKIAAVWSYSSSPYTSVGNVLLIGGAQQSKI